MQTENEDKSLKSVDTDSLDSSQETIKKNDDCKDALNCSPTQPDSQTVTKEYKDSHYKVDPNKTNENVFDSKQLKNEFRFMLIFLLCFTIVRCFIFDYYMIPSSSMVPGLLIGDMPLTRKWTYGYTKHSMWFSPELWSGRIMQSTKVKHGDIIVFKDPTDKETNIIKRVIGLEGDEVEVKDGIIYVNNLPAELKYKEVYTYIDERDNSISQFDLYEETLPYCTKKHDVVYDPMYKTLPHNNMSKVTVPKGFYFVMGDNRDRSKDSRCGLGLVPDLHIMGQADRVIYSIGNGVKLWQFWRWLTNIRYERIFKKIQ